MPMELEYEKNVRGDIVSIKTRSEGHRFAFSDAELVEVNGQKLSDVLVVPLR